MILLSIIVPIYNSEQYLTECLNSLQKCKCSQIEFILINDGSKDNTIDICNTFAQKDNRFIIINKKNEGVSATRNRGMKEAKGKYISFLDADDILKTEILENIVENIDKTEYDFQGFAYTTLFDSGRTVDEQFDFSEEQCSDLDQIKKILLTSPQLNTCWGKIYRKNIIDENQIFFRTDLKIGEDFIFVAEYMKHCKKVVLYNIPLLFYRQHSGSAMRNHNIDERLQILQILYQYNSEYIKCYKYDLFEESMQYYYLCMVTDLFLEFAKCNSKKELKRIYSVALEKEPVVQIIVEMEKYQVKSGMKKIEYYLLKTRCLTLLTYYFKTKNVVATMMRRG